MTKPILLSYHYYQCSPLLLWPLSNFPRDSAIFSHYCPFQNYHLTHYRYQALNSEVLVSRLAHRPCHNHWRKSVVYYHGTLQPTLHFQSLFSRDNRHKLSIHTEIFTWPRLIVIIEDFHAGCFKVTTFCVV